MRILTVSRILADSLVAAAMAVPLLHAQQTGAAIDPPAGAQVVFRVEAMGFQIYTCTGTPGGAKWVFTAPKAELLDAYGKPIGSHFAGPTWTLKRAGQGNAQGDSYVQGELVASKPAPEAGAIPWLLLRAKNGTAKGILANVAFIQRTDTHGGVAPQSGCESAQEAGKTAQIPYRAAYIFYSGPPAN
jgi:Protein of unknown function (DUF3455)